MIVTTNMSPTNFAHGDAEIESEKVHGNKGTLQLTG